MPYRTIDLCAGIGGIRRGFELAGEFQNVLSAEIDKYACQTYEHLYGENPENDVCSEEFKTMVENIQYEVLLAGFPCQTFSRAGQKKGFKDSDKGTIFFHIADIIRRTRPRAFLLENVDHLVTHQKGKTFETIIKTLVNDLEYKVVGVTQEGKRLIFDPHDFIRNSKDFGVPQNRPRVYIIGFNRRYYNNSVDMVPNDLPQKRGDAVYRDLNELLDENVEAKYYLSSGYFDTLVRHREREHDRGNGFGYRVVNTYDIVNPIANAILATGGSGKERNLIYDYREELVGLEVPRKHSPLNSRGIRTMTPNEWGKLQGFINYGFVNRNGEDLFEFPDGMSNAQKYKQFGNSVTIPAVEQMAIFVGHNLEILDQLYREMLRQEI